MFLSALLPVASLLVGLSAQPVPAGEPLARPAQLDPSAETGFRYDFAEAEVVLGDLSGLQLGASYGLGGALYASGTLAFLSGDEGPVDLDITTLSGGVTYVMHHRPELDFFGTAELEFGRAEASAFGASASDSELGLRLRAGARYAIDPTIEVFGAATVRTILDDHFAVDGGLRYHLSESLAIQARLELGDETLFAFGLRYSL